MLCGDADNDWVVLGDQLGNVYRLPKAGGEAEQLRQGGSPEQTRACHVRLSGAGTYFMDVTQELWFLTDDTPEVLVASGVGAFFVDGDRAYYQIQENDQVFVHEASGIQRRVSTQPGKLLLVRDGYLYYTRRGSTLLRVPAEEGAPDALVADPAGDDWGLAIADEHLYISTSRGQLWHGSLSSLPAKLELVDEHGPFDDDDSDPRVATDEHSVFWLAGAAPGVRADDDTPIVVFSTCR